MLFIIIFYISFILLSKNLTDLKGLAQAKIIKKSVFLFPLPNMTI